MKSCRLNSTHLELCNVRGLVSIWCFGRVASESQGHSAPGMHPPCLICYAIWLLSLLEGEGGGGFEGEMHWGRAQMGEVKSGKWGQLLDAISRFVRGGEGGWHTHTHTHTSPMWVCIIEDLHNHSLSLTLSASVSLCESGGGGTPLFLTPLCVLLYNSETCRGKSQFAFRPNQALLKSTNKNTKTRKKTGQKHRNRNKHSGKWKWNSNWTRNRNRNWSWSRKLNSSQTEKMETVENCKIFVRTWQRSLLSWPDQSPLRPAFWPICDRCYRRHRRQAEPDQTRPGQKRPTMPTIKHTRISKKYTLPTGGTQLSSRTRRKKREFPEIIINK